jgi:hypothetical protein
MIGIMAKKRKTTESRPGGKHVTPRVPYQLPLEFAQLARKLAGQRKQPTLWYLLSLIIEDAKANGMETPAPPWEEDRQK